MYKDIHNRHTMRQNPATPAPAPKPAANSCQVIHPSTAALLAGAIPGLFAWIFFLFPPAMAMPESRPYIGGAFAIWIVWRFLKLVFARAAASYTISPEVITARLGLISRSVVQVRVADIRGMSFRQGIFGRLFGYGDVVLGTAATADAELVMRAVSSPAALVDEIDALRR